MAKKAKRRGRPPGSKNKTKSVGTPSKDFAKMDVGQLRVFIGTLEKVLAAKIQQQREYLEGQIAGLQIYASNKTGGAVRAAMRAPKTGKRRKAEPKYQSKQDKRLTWTGRGMLPVWMREEMKGTNLTKDSFLIK